MQGQVQDKIWASYSSHQQTRPLPMLLGAYMKMNNKCRDLSCSPENMTNAFVLCIVVIYTEFFWERVREYRIIYLWLQFIHNIFKSINVEEYCFIDFSQGYPWMHVSLIFCLSFSFIHLSFPLMHTHIPRSHYPMSQDTCTDQIHTFVKVDVVGIWVSWC